MGSNSNMLTPLTSPSTCHNPDLQLVMTGKHSDMFCSVCYSLLACWRWGLLICGCVFTRSMQMLVGGQCVLHCRLDSCVCHILLSWYIHVQVSFVHLPQANCYCNFVRQTISSLNKKMSVIYKFTLSLWVGFTLGWLRLNDGHIFGWIIPFLYLQIYFIWL